MALFERNVCLLVLWLCLSWSLLNGLNLWCFIVCAICVFVLSSGCGMLSVGVVLIGYGLLFVIHKGLEDSLLGGNPVKFCVHL